VMGAKVSKSSLIVVIVSIYSRAAKIQQKSEKRIVESVKIVTGRKNYELFSYLCSVLI